VLRSVQVFMMHRPTVTKKVVGVFVRFSCAASLVAGAFLFFLEVENSR
jgi:hypothetical protein